MDQFTIKPQGLQLIDLFGNDPGNRKSIQKHRWAMGVPGSFEVTRREHPSGTETLLIELGPFKAIRVTARREEQVWCVRKIEGNLPKLLYGDNAVTISDERVWLVGLTRLQDIVGCIVPEAQRFSIIPGLQLAETQNGSYWDKVSFPVHVADPEGRLLAVLQNMRHPGMRKATWRYDGESIKLQGTAKGIGIYDKYLETTKRHRRGEVEKPEVPILRIECTWGAGELVTRARDLGIHIALAPRPDGTMGKPNVLHFNLLYQMLRATLAETSGVFLRSQQPKAPQKSHRGTAMFLAELAKNRDIPLAELLDLDRRSVARSDKTRADLRREAERCLENLQTLPLVELLPEAGPPLLSRIQVPGAREEVELMSLAKVPSKDIAQVYGDKFDELCLDKFNPHHLFSAL